MENEVLICECHSTEHQIVVYHDKEDKSVYLHVHLVTHDNFFKRLWKGLKYAFGYNSRFGHWDEFILNPQDAHKIENILKTLKNINQ